MNLYLLTYHRDGRHETQVEVIDDQTRAIERLFAAELEARLNPAVEVVLLTAADADDLRRTHSRYFESVEQLLAG